MIRVLSTLKNGEVTKMEIEGGDALPKFIRSNQAAAAWLLEDQGRDPATLITFRNAGSQHDSFVPATIGAWAARSAMFSQSRSAAAVLKTAFAAQSLPQRPGKITKTGQVWAMMDELGLDATNAQAVALGAVRGLDAGTVRVQAAKWRKAKAIKAARQ